MKIWLVENAILLKELVQKELLIPELKLVRIMQRLALEQQVKRRLELRIVTN